MSPPRTTNAMPLLRGGAVWLLIAITETLHGIARTVFLEPEVGDLRARQIGVFTGSVLILGIALLFVNWLGARTRSALLGVGALWLLLMLAFEVGTARALGYSWQRIGSDYDPRVGGLMLLGMVVLLLAPLFAARLRGLDRPASATTLKAGPRR